jgi:serine/threonine protein phosphatase PrpC
MASATGSMCLAHEVIQILELETGEIPRAFAQAFTKVNDRLRLLHVADGCTAAAVFFRDNMCFAAGVGDARIVRVTRTGAQRVSVDAKPTLRSEFDRLRMRGVVMNTEGRICRKLAVARSLGDFWCDGGTFVEPDVAVFEIGEDDDALIIACDGLWDVIEDEWAGLFVRNSRTAASAAVTLKNYAYAMGSKDNISAVVVKLHPEPGDEGLCGRNTVEILEPPPPDPEEDEDDFPALPVPRGGGRRRG